MNLEVKKMGEYKVIITDYSVDDLEEMVNKYIKQGWKPQGGIVVISERIDLFSSRNTYYQAIYKEE